MSEEETAGSKGIVTCSAEFSDELETLSKMFGKKKDSPKREAARFAMAIGIQRGEREPRSEWKKPTKKNKISTIAHLFGQFDKGGQFDFQLLFEMLDLFEDGDDTPLHHLISEYVTGGMRYIKDNELYKLDEWSRMKDDFPHLFTEDE